MEDIHVSCFFWFQFRLAEFITSIAGKLEFISGEVSILFSSLSFISGEVNIFSFPDLPKHFKLYFLFHL